MPAAKKGNALHTSDSHNSSSRDASFSPAKFAEVIDSFDAVFLDVYGVLLSGAGLYDHTPALISWLQSQRKPFLLVSNGSSRTLTESAKAYQSQGIAVEPHEIMTSGALLRYWVAEQGLQGQRALVLGRKASYPVISESGLVPVVKEDGEDVDVVVVLNQADNLLEQIDHALTTIIHRIDQDKPIQLVCPNPDCLYPKSADSFGITAGAIAELLEGALAKRYGIGSQLQFTRLGKPYPMIFAKALAKLSEHWQRSFAPQQVLMVGDQIATDVKGALDYGLGAMLYQGGVANIAKFKNQGLSSSGAQRSFYISDHLYPPSATSNR